MEFPQTRLLLSKLGKSIGSDVSCLTETCHHVMSEYNCSCAKTLTNRTCEEISDPAIVIVLWSISAAILFLFVVELFVIWWFKSGFLDNCFGKLVFSMGIVSSTVTQLCTMQFLEEKSNSITVWYNVILGVVSVFFMCFGYHFLFENHANNIGSLDNNIGFHDRGMGLVVVIISVFIVGLESILVMMVLKTKDPSDSVIMFLIVCSCEKIVQVVIYVGARRCRPRRDYERGTVFYFSFLSFLNFTLWLNHIPFTDIPIYDEVSHSHVLRYVDETFKALVLDYRLLCALLFLEHAFAISQKEYRKPNTRTDETTLIEMPGKRYFYTSVGVGIGLVCMGLEALNGAQFWHEGLLVFVNICPILSDAMLVAFGCMLLVNVGISILHDEKKVNLVSLMVTSMGAASIVYLFCFGLLALTSFEHDKPVSYVRFSAFVYLVRGSSLFVLLLVYTGIPVSTMESSDNHNTTNYILVSALSCGLFARFLGSILDEFDGTMHEIAHHHLESSKLRPLRDLFALGPLFQLAASLHLSLHFLLMVCRLHEKQKIVIGQVNEGQGVVVGGGNENAEASRNGGVPVQQNGVHSLPWHRRREKDSAFESSGVHQFQCDDGPCDERTPLLQRMT